ncbi:MAG: hypothetical protein ACETWM_20010 [Candidatus Lokiarchaeia archaeon]
MLYMLVVLFPPDKAKVCGEIFLKLPEPTNFKYLGIYHTSDGEHGIKAYQLIEVEKGKEEEGFSELMGRLAKFIDVEGFRWTLESLLGLEDSLKLIGLA